MDEKTVLIKGFNAGYWLEKYEPELSKIIQNSFGDRNHPYAEGFIKGSKEFTQEQIMESSHTVSIENQEIQFERFRQVNWSGQQQRGFRFGKITALPYPTSFFQSGF